jgi:hypothetical protein
MQPTNNRKFDNIKRSYKASPLASEFLAMPQRVVPSVIEYIVPPRKKNKPRVIIFAAAALVMLLAMQSLVYVSGAKNAQGEILGAATSAYSNLSSAGDNLKNQNFTDAKLQFDSALENLQTAQGRLNDFKALQLVAPQAKSANSVLTGASLLAQAGQKVSEAMAGFSDLKISHSEIGGQNIADLLLQNKNTIDQALSLTNQAAAAFNSISGLPKEYADTLDSAKRQVAVLSGLLQNLSDFEDIYLGLFGSGPKVYLLAFENYNEVRATGGFIGTYGVLNINAGKIQNLKIGSIYNLDGHIYDQIAAPGPMQPDIKKWGIRDANWFVDFPTSARKLLQFFESGSQTADGVIAFTPAIFQDLLNITGPIVMDDYDVTLNADNFQDVVQFETSVNYDRKLNDPKKFLADFAPVLLDKLSGLTQDQLLGLLQVVQSNLNQKQVLLYTKDSNLQQKIQDVRLSGATLATDADYLDIVNTNLGGTKTDLKINQSAVLKSKILSDGSIMDTLEITRQSDALADNKDYMRILVPLGSTIISSAGFDPGIFNSSVAEGFKADPDLANWDIGEIFDNNTFVRQEAGKTEFAGWLKLRAGESRTIRLTYMIPYKAQVDLIGTTSYSLLFQKQNGVPAYNFNASLDTGSLKQAWLSAGSSMDSNLVKFDYNTKSDQYWAVVLKK